LWKSRYIRNYQTEWHIWQDIGIDIDPRISRERKSRPFIKRLLGGSLLNREKKPLERRVEQCCKNAAIAMTVITGLLLNATSVEVAQARDEALASLNGLN
jgi:hypothetical protein